MFNEGDAATLPAMYIEDACALPPMTHGRGDFQQF